ncbi:MAG: O-methyltransferase [Pseudomonadota bacterium]
MENETNRPSVQNQTSNDEEVAAGPAAAVDAYFSELLAPETSALTEARIKTAKRGMPAHAVSAVQGKFLHLLVKITHAKRVLEIGTLGGYSTIWMADALPENGAIDTIEIDPDYAETARQNLKRAGHDGVVTVHTGKALDILPTLSGPFDLIFIDADKPNNPAYLDAALTLSRPGTVIIGDNVVRGGGVVDPAPSDERVRGVRSFLQALAQNPRISATAVQTTGEKGWDGFAMAVVAN